SRRSIDEDFKEVGKMIGYEPTVAQSFLGGLFEIVRSNGEKLNEMQVRFLLRGEERLKLTPGTLRSWIRGGYAPPQHDPSVDRLSLEEAYDALGLARDCTDADLKKTYRAKAADFHPDKLRSKNLPEEFVAFANDQLAKINQAHQVIREARGLN
ncbi:MAG: DnaJ domain-containing protein, partial [Verrucomicrobiota bacterium]|nr:DnaJ domain-containing protein [Verrucomicrobiota bacterium]